MDTEVEPNSERVHLCIRCGLGLHPDAAVCPRCGAEVPEVQVASNDTDSPADLETRPPYGPSFGYVPSSGAAPGSGSEHGFSTQAELGSEPAAHPAEPPSAFDSGSLPDGDSQPEEEPMAPHVAATPEPAAGADHLATQEWEAIPAGFDVPAAEEPNAAAPAAEADRVPEPAAGSSFAAQPLPTVNLAPRPAQPHRRWAALGWALAVLAIIAAVVGFSTASHQKHLADDARALARRQTEAVTRLHGEVASLTQRLRFSSNVTTGIKAALAGCRSAISLDTQYAGFVQDIVTGIARLDRAAYDRGTAGVASLGPKVKAANDTCLAGANA